MLRKSRNVCSEPPNTKRQTSRGTWSRISSFSVEIFWNFTKFLTDQTIERISSIKSHYRLSDRRVSTESERRAQSREFIQSAREFKEASLAIKILEGRYLENDLSDRQIIQTQLEKHFQKVYIT